MNNEVSFREFVEFKEEYLKDSDPIYRFGQAFCDRFGIDNLEILNSPTFDVCRGRIEKFIRWVI